jgi:hypothetical protein
MNSGLTTSAGMAKKAWGRTRRNWNVVEAMGVA